MYIVDVIIFRQIAYFVMFSREQLAKQCFEIIFKLDLYIKILSFQIIQKLTSEQDLKKTTKKLL